MACTVAMMTVGVWFVGGMLRCNPISIVPAMLDLPNLCTYPNRTALPGTALVIIWTPVCHL